MTVSVKFYVLCFCLACLFLENTGLKHVKVWKPNTNILNRENWIDPNSQEHCNTVEFGEYNSAPIYIDKLVAHEFVLPYSGEINILDGGYLRIVDENIKEKTNCLKLKEIQKYDYLDPRNWDSDVANNPAVPDKEKLPCRDDTINIPNNLYSGMDVSNLHGYHTVSSVSTDDISRTIGAQRKCLDPTGCLCNEEEFVECPPSKTPDCLSPIHPIGFCHAICGAYTSFKSTPGFDIQNIEQVLKDYSDVFTHVSKVDDDIIQVVFAEKEYSGDSVVYAEKFFERLQGESRKFRISDLKALKASGAQTTGNASFATVFFTSLFFVLGLFALIFFVYGDRRWLSNVRFGTVPSFPLTSTYRARFSSREDESGLIFDTQSLAGSVLNLRQSFDNPMFGEASKAEDNTDIEKIDTTEANVPGAKPIENSQNDPLLDLEKLNGELNEEIGSDIMEDFQSSMNFRKPLVDGILPLIEVEEIED